MRTFLGMTEEQLGEVLKKYRLEHKYTQKKIADYLDVDRTTYSKYETVRKPELDVIMKLAALYDVSANDFFEKFFAVIPEKTVTASSAISNADSEHLAEDELQLVMLYRDCIRKKDVLEKARKIWAEDKEIKSESE